MFINKTFSRSHQKTMSLNKGTSMQNLKAILWIFLIVSGSPLSVCFSQELNLEPTQLTIEGDVKNDSGAAYYVPKYNLADNARQSQASLEPADSLKSINVSITPNLATPKSVMFDHDNQLPAQSLKSISLEPTGLIYQRLLFEEPDLERHGHALNRNQPAISGLKFFTRGVLFPLGISKMRSCETPPGRPSVNTFCR
jgi:hypothetical protein